MPGFSVLMTNYNNAHTIDQAIQSVLAQTVDDWELVIVEDASTDDSLERIRPHLADSRIRLLRLDRNLGYTRAQIHGLEQVQGEIVGILDSDDALLPEALESVANYYERHPKVGLLLSQIILCDADLSPLMVTVNTERHLGEPLLWQRGVTHFRTFRLAAYRRAAPLDRRLRSASDLDLIFKIEEVAEVARLNVPLLKYRKAPASLSQAGRGYFFSNREAALTVYQAYLRRRGTDVPYVPLAWVQAWLHAAVRYSLELGERGHALLFALRALRLAPLAACPYRTLGQALQGLPLTVPLGETRPGGRSFFALRSFQSNTGNREPDRLICLPQVHQAGHALFGDDHTILSSGRYRVSFDLSIRACSFARGPLVVLDVYENSRHGASLAEWPVSMEEARQGRCGYPVEFAAEQGQRVEFRVYWREQCELSIHGVVLEYFP